MNLQRIAAFSRGDLGGNPAGVALLSAPLSDQDMARIAADVGYSETVFAYPLSEDRKQWRLRYFSPESEVPFCGHATIALGAVLGETYGLHTYALNINQATIEVTAVKAEQGIAAVLTSPNTQSRGLSDKELNETLSLFNLHASDLDAHLPPAKIHGGADHIVLPLKQRETLAAMRYDLNAGREMMDRHGLVTIMLVYTEDAQTFHSRNAFASGGVLEDPATGAASAAFAGYLRDRQWPHGGSITLYQGEDMGAPSVINVSLTDEPGAPVLVSGSTRKL
ncbi:PhzF family phenazine biosynthesis protein [Aestuariibacter sp. GS-14]|uniref:PhzF family phenazine biosynthesis protein n=1 Tax=Aestuariibacter sp. GS-14 TaxID=2590670 RepID=UPI00112ACC6E|nr:PhzF family phenazine biosynthesis protein [Aestuariibacter sp. GS-14]TPV56461.1 PhzF family phenazine biosynthesis protein [Aestuariibacter sp. GS-14]